MSSYQSQYANILNKLIESPKKVGESRVGNIRSNFGEQIRVDLSKEFPLMEIKKIKFSNIVHELLWMIRGESNVKYLIENDCHIWTDDAWRYYNEKYKSHDADPVETKEEFVKKVLVGQYMGLKYIYKYGDLDRIYGFQWRKFNGETDQLQNVINTLRTNPDDRRMIITGHNPNDIEKGVVGLPSCHNYCQFYTNVNEDGKRILSTFVNIRSNDFFLGNPYNVAQYALLTHIIARIVDMEVGEMLINMVDCHLYEKHLDAAKEWLRRYEETVNEHYVGYCRSSLNFSKFSFTIDNISNDDILLSFYQPQGFIKAPLLT